MTNIAPVTRRVARIVFSTLKKIGSSRGVTLKKIHEYIRLKYPNSPNDIVKLNNTLQKALAFGAVNKRKDRYVLGNVLKGMIKGHGSHKIIQARRRRSRRARRGRIGRGRRRRGGRRRTIRRRR
ncbi:unnamed protein product [Phaedon cochleariae]|uniref:Histone H1 n=1 Tax=Phaedon cochleariae TaxID=80249 RepID=A0A9N9SBQ4_PHACE|nr:unnamed protein product [Phaedon cochleariae]